MRKLIPNNYKKCLVRCKHTGVNLCCIDCPGELQYAVKCLSNCCYQPEDYPTCVNAASGR